MRRIFVALQAAQDAASLLRLAGDLAASFGAQIEAAIINDVAAIGDEQASGALSGAGAGAGAGVGVGVGVGAWAVAGAVAARDAFGVFAAANPGVTAAWREIPDGVVYAGATLGRASDLILTRSARRPADQEGVAPGDREARSFRDALLASGRLTLLAPAALTDGASLLDRVVVAWDGSAGAAHALAQSLGLLARAKSLRVVIVGRNTLGEGAREAIASYAALHHPGAALVVRDNAHRQTGRVLLDALREERASLVVMGVHGRSHAAGGGAGTPDGTAVGTALGGTILKVIEDGRIPILTAV